MSHTLSALTLNSSNADSNATSGSPRLPVLDAVRGLAICMVVAVHFTPDYLMPNRPLEWAKKLFFTGWIGVDLFFVLSGFLITDILLRARNAAHGMRHFYARRALRILPLYFSALIVVFGILPFFVPAGSDPEFDIIRQSTGWYWAHCANVVVLLHGFAATTSDTVNLGHLWSLAVEEHFYLFWPFLVMWLPERKLPVALLWVIGMAFTLRLTAIALLQEPHLTGAFVQTPLRMDALALGALLPVAYRRIPPPALRKAALRAFPVSGAILAGDFLVEKGLWPRSNFICSIGFGVIAIFFASFLALMLTSKPDDISRRFIDNRVFRFFGKYSYGIYVIHFLLAPTLERFFPAAPMLASLGSPVAASVVCVALKTAVSVALALVSWRFIEAPFLKLSRAYAIPRAVVAQQIFGQG